MTLQHPCDSDSTNISLRIVVLKLSYDYISSAYFVRYYTNLHSKFSCRMSTCCVSSIEIIYVFQNLLMEYALRKS